MRRARVVERALVERGAASPRPPSTAAIDGAFEEAARLVAARLALAAVRERLAPGSIRGGGLELDGLGVCLPLARAGPFELHTPELVAERSPLLEDPVALAAALSSSFVDALGPAARLDRVAAELADSVFNLGLALLCASARRVAPPPAPGLVESEQAVVVGHPWHPMTKTRLGLSLRDNLVHAPELLGRAPIVAVDVVEDLSLRSGDADAALAAVFPPPPPGWVRVPALALQARRLPALLGAAWGREARLASVTEKTGRSLLSLRTASLGRRAGVARPLHLKLAMDVITTSARRTVSPMSVANGPHVSALLERIMTRDPLARGRLAIMADVAGAGLSSGRFGDAAAQLGVIVREHPGPLARALAGDDATIWVCAALGERRSDRDEPRCVALCDGYSGDAASRGAAMLRDYVELLAPPLLRLLCAHGVALEAHLQNSLVVFAGGRPRGFVLRDLGGVRLHGPRLARAGHAIELADGSFIATNSAEELRDKLAHVLFHAHLAAVFDWTAQATGADPRAAWAYTRQLVHERLGAWAADPELRADCLADREALLAPRVRAKALLRMRLTGASSDYDYTEVANALAPAPGDDAPRERLLNASGGQGYRP